MTARLSFALLLFAISGLNQPASAASPGAAKHVGAEIQARLLSDAQIERTIKAKLAKSKLSADHFTVSVNKGVATIEGNTSVMQHKGVMTRMAKTSGATGVRNNIRISDAARAKAVAGLAKIRTTTPVPRETVTSAAPSIAPVNGASTAAPSIPRASVLPPGSTR